jgi:RNA polymerase sigma-70 factor (ECF subfamily)
MAPKHDSPSSPPDDELVSKIAAGDSKAFEILFDRHTPKFLGYATRLLAGDRMTAEDIVQNNWIKVVQMASGYESRGHFVAWAYTMIRNQCLDELRRRQKFASAPAVDEEQDSAEQLVDNAPSTLERLISDSDQHRLIEAIDALPEQQRAVLMTSLTEELSYEDLAQQFRTTVSSIKSILFRARENLSKKMKEDS